MAYCLLLRGCALLGSLPRHKANVGAGAALSGHKRRLVGDVLSCLLIKHRLCRVRTRSVSDALKLVRGRLLLTGDALKALNRTSLRANAAGAPELICESALSGKCLA